MLLHVKCANCLYEGVDTFYTFIDLSKCACFFVLQEALVASCLGA